MPLPVEMLRSALRYFERLDQSTQKRFREKIAAIAEAPTDIRLSKPLVGVDKRSSRVGDYRILFFITEERLVITNIDNRGDVYKALSR